MSREDLLSVISVRDPFLGVRSFLNSFQALVQENHQHLVSLGVSHPVLETIRETTLAAPYGLSTKLTGAGGGGCAVTLIPDGEFECLIIHSIY